MASRSLHKLSEDTFNLVDLYLIKEGFPDVSVIKNLPANAGDAGLTLGREDSLEKERATHSSILAWRISWKEEPGRLQSTGSLRVGHD